MSSSKLFSPIDVGRMTLQHRVVLAPMTRMRASQDGVPGSLVNEYYTQRASVPGTLLITEATIISAQAVGIPGIPGIYSDEQVAAWKEASTLVDLASLYTAYLVSHFMQVVDSVHSKGSFIYLQIAALGRVANRQYLEAKGLPYVSASSVPPPGSADTVPPRPLTLAEIEQYVKDFEIAAFNAVYRAGFDGVEVHAGNGSLIDQFLHESANQRTDQYGGPIENRARFLFEVVHAVVKAVGEERTSVRLTPWYQGELDSTSECSFGF